MSDGSGTDGATVTVALLVGHDDDFVVVRNNLVLEALGRSGARETVGGGIRERVAEFTGN
jgi:hypothetical protein